MKNTIISILLLFGFLTACNQTGNNKNKTNDSLETTYPQMQVEGDSLSEVITRFVRAYASQDNGKANQLVHPELGLTIIYRPGVSDSYVKVDSMDFSNPVPSYYSYPKFTNEAVLTYDKLPIYSCETEQWDKEGFYCDTTVHPNQLSAIALFEQEFNELQFTDEMIAALKKEEQESYRIIITAREPLVFHVRKYKNAWYVTTLDRAYAGCDA